MTAVILCKGLWNSITKDQGKFEYMKYLYLSILVMFFSCFRNETCHPLYIGAFKIDLTRIANPDCLGQVVAAQWDTVKLVSTANGQFFLLTTDKRLKECEGEWSVSSDDIEGHCSGYIKQKNRPSETLSMPFDIVIKMSDQACVLPFRRIDQRGEFIKIRDTLGNEIKY